MRSLNNFANELQYSSMPFLESFNFYCCLFLRPIALSSLGSVIINLSLRRNVQLPWHPLAPLRFVVPIGPFARSVAHFNTLARLRSIQAPHWRGHSHPSARHVQARGRKCKSARTTCGAPGVWHGVLVPNSLVYQQMGWGSQFYSQARTHTHGHT